MEQALASDAAYQIFLHNMNTLPAGIERQHLRGKSERILPLLKDAHFDVVFVDADHTYTHVKRDIDLSLRLVKEGGILCGDDLNLQLHEVDAAHAKANGEQDFIPDPKTGRNYHPGVTLAVAERFGPVSSWGGFWAMQRQGESWKPITLRDMPVHFPAHFPPEAVERARAHLADISPLS